VQRGVVSDRGAGEQERCAVALRLRGHFGSDHAAGPTTIVDHYLGSREARQLGANDTRYDVDGAAGRERHDQAHRLVGKALSLRSHD
jgi:hypothetical protein